MESVPLHPSQTLVLWHNQHPPMSLANLEESDVVPALGQPLSTAAPGVRAKNGWLET